MKKLLGVILLVVIVAIGLIGIRFGSALFQEENTSEIIVSIIKLEFTNNDYIQISDQSQETRYVSKKTNGSQENIIKEFMEKNEWKYIEQMGAGYIFEKGEVAVVVETKLFTKSYFLWDVPKEVLN